MSTARRARARKGGDPKAERDQDPGPEVLEQRIRSVFEHALVGIYRTTPQGEIILANPALMRLLGLSSMEELRELDLNAEGFDRRTPRHAFLERIDREGSVHGMECTWKRKDGKVVHLRDSATAIKDEEGRTLYYEGTLEDVTENVAHKQRIEQLNQSLRVVNTILRHDVLNDLNVAMGSLELYRQNRDERLLAMSEASMRKCSNLIRKTKELESIISTGELRAMSARDVIREVLGHYSSYPLEARVRGDGLILADEAVVPALDNLVSNAMVHGRSDSVDLEVRPGQGRGWCEIRVSDQGKGVPNEIKDLVFQEGFRFGDTGNTGLGLYIVRKTMERYGGDVRVEDNRPQGATFVLRFRAPVGRATRPGLPPA